MRELLWRWRNPILYVAVTVAISLLVAAFAWLAYDLLRVAWPRLGWELISALPRRAGRAGGISSILVATLLILLVCWSVVLPLGFGTAVALAGSRGRWTRWLRSSLDVLAGIPSIVLGLFGLLVFGDLLGWGFSLASGGMTLACMILPLVIRLADAALRSVPPGLHAQAAALGLSRSTTLRRLIVPAALPGLVAAIALGTARALSETAALVFTAGGSDRMPHALSDPGRTLAMHIYDLALNVAGGDASAAASAVLLMLALVVINGAGMLLLKQCQRRPS